MLENDLNNKDHSCHEHEHKCDCSHKHHHEHEHNCSCNHDSHEHHEHCSCSCHEHHHEEKTIEISEKEFNNVIKITGLDCAACGMELKEEIIKKVQVKKVEVDFINQKVYLNCSKDKLALVEDVCNHFEDVKVVGKETKQVNMLKKNVILIAIGAVLLCIAIALEKFVNINYVQIPIYLAAYLVCGYPVLLKAIKNISKGKIFDENFLMAIASIGAMIISEMIEGVVVMVLYQIGEQLQNVAVNSSRKQITKIVDLKATEAFKIVNGEYIQINPEDLQIGDNILIKKGDKIPVDCILEEDAYLDTKSLTGESEPKLIKKGEVALSGCINVSDAIIAKVEKTYKNSAVAKILELVENSTVKKAEPEKFITKFAKYYTPIVCIIAFCIATIIPLFVSIASEMSTWAIFKNYINKALILLVISCPCALIISVPLTYFGSIGSAAKENILIKGAVYIDALTKIDTVALDKTGTLTEGIFEIKNIEGEDKDFILNIASACEKVSNHPIAKAFEKIQSNILLDEINEIVGYGFKCVYKNETYYIGNESLLKNNNIAIEKINSISTIIYVANKEKVIGYIEIDDKIKQDALEGIKSLKDVGINKIVMLTGDNEKRAQFVAEKLGINDVKHSLLPQDKLNEAKILNNNNNLIYVGDGINDAPVMAEASVSMSMGSLGADAAIEASDVVICNDKLSQIAKTIKIAKKTKKIVIENIAFSIIAKAVFMVLGVLNIIPLNIAVFGDVGVMLIAVLNSLRMKAKIN